MFLGAVLQQVWGAILVRLEAALVRFLGVFAGWFLCVSWGLFSEIEGVVLQGFGGTRWWDLGWLLAVGFARLRGDS